MNNHEALEYREQIRNAYRLTGGNSFYDGMITCSTPLGRAVCRAVAEVLSAAAVTMA